jgi:two-component system, cell cycle response regulator DivK
MNPSMAAEVHELGVMPHHAPAHESRTKPLLLAIDDDPDNLLLLIHILKRLGYDFITAMDGQSGLDLAIGHHPDLILLDIMLPKLDGYEFMHQMKLYPETKFIPAIAVTALAKQEDCEKISLAGFVDLVVKPYIIEDLRVKLARWICL